ncbi:unnamed protein product [Owenia fusiformis]|uniref:Nucleoporin NUP35 n=1 Tax=Owenia fusiformis TaxID=6347 RepID=A0A8S4NZM3_OWEFU|nr:unnamed protein product [Owenia fusiformis]
MFSNLADNHGLTEPMTLGSPVSSPQGHAAHTPSTPQIQHGQPYLPGYLLGDPQPSASPRLWSSSSGGSPNTSKINLNRSGSWTSPNHAGSHTPMGSHTPRTETRQRDLLGHRTKDKVGAPPVQGLWEQTAPPTQSPYPGPPGATQLETSGISRSMLNTPGQSTQQAHGNESIFSPNQSHSFIQQSVASSPPQVDPFYTQGEAISPDEILDETWVTIYGFPPAATSFVMQQFSQYGNILKHVVATEGNWMHLHYQSKIQAKKALSKNGKIFGNSIMVGVSPCIDKSIMEAVPASSVNTSQLSHLNTSQFPGGHTPHLADMSCDQSMRPTPIRPLTAAYRAASSEHEVVQNGSTPRKSSNIVSKAMEYMFGW